MNPLVRVLFVTHFMVVMMGVALFTHLAIDTWRVDE